MADRHRGITRDEAMYPDPETFNPERWLSPAYPTYKEPLTQYPNLQGYSQFGFGRRTCQGIPIVEQDLYLAMGGMAWAFSIQKRRRPDGTEIPVHWNEFTPLLIAKPKPFVFDAVVRSEETMGLLKAMYESATEGEEEEVIQGVDVSEAVAPAEDLSGSEKRKVHFLIPGLDGVDVKVPGSWV